MKIPKVSKVGLYSKQPSDVTVLQSGCILEALPSSVFEVLRKSAGNLVPHHNPLGNAVASDQLLGFTLRCRSPLRTETEPHAAQALPTCTK